MPATSLVFDTKVICWHGGRIDHSNGYDGTQGVGWAWFSAGGITHILFGLTDENRTKFRIEDIKKNLLLILFFVYIDNIVFTFELKRNDYFKMLGLGTVHK